MELDSHYNVVVIIGAGAAGLMCAMAAGEHGRDVLLLKHALQMTGIPEM